MTEDIQFCIEEAKEKMQEASSHLDSELLKLRAGKADVNILNSVYVDYYGANSPLNQVSNISTPDPKTIAIRPWEKSMIQPIEKAIMAANLGLTPVNDGEIIRINIPPLTEERRKDLVKQIKHEGENAKISIRNARRDANETLKKFKKEGASEDEIKDAEKKVQDVTDKYSKKVDELVERKEKEVMTV